MHHKIAGEFNSFFYYTKIFLCFLHANCWPFYGHSISFNHDLNSYFVIDFDKAIWMQALQGQPIVALFDGSSG